MKRIFGVALIGFSFLIMGCAVKISDVAVKPTLQYNLCQEQEGLKIAIDLFSEKERLKEYFGTDLVSHGILPVLIIAENHHPKAGYLLNKTFFFATRGTDKEQETKKDLQLPEYPIKKEAAELRMMSLIVGGVLLLQYANKIEGDILKINDNLSKKAFIDRTLFPGEFHSGFIYFQFKNRAELQNISTIMIKAKHILSEKDIDFIFQINK